MHAPTFWESMVAQVRFQRAGFSGVGSSCFVLHISYRRLRCGDLMYLEKRDREKLFRVIVSLGIFSEVVYNRFREDAYLQRVVCLPTACCVYSSWLRLLSSSTQLEICLDIYEAQQMLYLLSQRCASADWHWEENMADKLSSRSIRLTIAWAVPPFLLAQNLSLKWIAPTDNMWPDFDDGYSRHS